MNLRWRLISKSEIVNSNLMKYILHSFIKVEAFSDEIKKVILLHVNPLRPNTSDNISPLKQGMMTAIHIILNVVTVQYIFR